MIERMLPETFTPEARKLYLRSIYFLVKSVRNEYRRSGDYEGWLQDAGFRRVETLRPARDPNRFFEGLHVVVAEK